MTVNTQARSSSTREDILLYLLKRGPARAQDLAQALAVSPQAIRRHLKELEAHRSIEYRSVREGMGRPQHVYQLTDVGRSHFPKKYDEFSVSLLDSLAETVGEAAVDTILQKQWQDKALEYRKKIGTGSVRDRVCQLVEIRRHEGYMAELIEVDGEPGVEQFAIAEYNCAISNVAESYPVVCGHELLTFAAALPDCKVERTHRIIDGESCCCYVVRLIHDNSNG